MRAQILRIAPWALSVGAFGVLLLIPPGGLVLAAGWAVVVLIVRLIAASVGSRAARIWTGAVFVLVCFLAAFEGGWYVLPAAVAFLVADASGADPPVAPWQNPPLEVVAAFGSAIAGWIALAAFIWGPLYSSRSATATSDGTSSATTAVSLAAVGITPRAFVFLGLAAVLLAVILTSAWIHARFRRNWARRVIAAATAGLAVIAAAGAMTVGVWLTPALVLALLTWMLGREVTPPRTASGA
jgi:hypothetical protein